ncbi:hypothetical protein F0U61_45690 [Archangium violaceum]|uniref:hypothetical protein n=1 Tax=Archangium violaceum TaxID=83451 RepID=UPI002B2F58B2|nr:hypothetical protein F0U61_45690 [Archangium violaceum]
MQEPFRKIYLTLQAHNHPTGEWRYNVKIAASGDAIYIGDNSNHCTVLSYDSGFHHTEGGSSLNGQHRSYTTIERMLERAEYYGNAPFYTDKIRNALRWLRDNQVPM